MKVTVTKQGLLTMTVETDKDRHTLERIHSFLGNKVKSMEFTQEETGENKKFLVEWITLQLK